MGSGRLAVSTAVKKQKAVSAYFTSSQILPFGFAEQIPGQCEAVDGQWSVCKHTENLISGWGLASVHPRYILYPSQSTHWATTLLRS